MTTLLINTQIPSKDQIPLCNKYSINLDQTEIQLHHNNKIHSENDKNTKDQAHKPGFTNNCLELSDWNLESLEKKLNICGMKLSKKIFFMNLIHYHFSKQ